MKKANTCLKNLRFLNLDYDDDGDDDDDDDNAGFGVA